MSADDDMVRFNARCAAAVFSLCMLIELLCFCDITSLEARRAAMIFGLVSIVPGTVFVRCCFLLSGPGKLYVATEHKKRRIERFVEEIPEESLESFFDRCERQPVNADNNLW